MKKVFIFGVGDSNRIKGLVDDVISSGLTPILGPTKKDHEYLYDNSDYYRKSYDLKIYSFCSDVWRAYILSKEVGMYIDTSVEIGENFGKYYDEALANDIYLVRQNGSYLASCIMASSANGNKIFSDLFKEFLKKLPENPRFYHIFPYGLSAYFIKKCGMKKIFFDIEFFELDGVKIFIDKLTSIRDKDTIFKYGTGSGMQNNEKNNHLSKYGKVERDTGVHVEKEGVNKKTKFGYRRKVDLCLENGYWVLSPIGIRDQYEGAKNKNDRKIARIAFKNLEFKTKFSEKLIGSKLNVFFTKGVLGK